MKIRAVAGVALAAAVLSPVASNAQVDVRSSSIPSYHLMQLSISSVQQSLDTFRTQTEALSSCSEARDLARSIGAEIKRDRFVRATELPATLRDEIEALSTGQATQVFSDDGETMRVIVLCNRA